MKKTGYETVCGLLPPGVRDRLLALSGEKRPGIREIRLRAQRPVCLVGPDGGAYLTAEGGLVLGLSGEEPCLSKSELTECFRFLTRFSASAFEEQLAEGFFPLPGGHRAGVCGRAVYRQGQPLRIERLTSINIRIAQADIFPLPDALQKLLHEGSGGILIGGPPACGKTTMLRGCVWAMGNDRRQYAVVDEREELFPDEAVTPPNCDVLSGYKKAEGILQCVRLLSPEAVFCDEIGGRDEAEAISGALRAGVRIIAALHCGDYQDMLARPQAKEVLRTGAFSHYVLLGGSPGHIEAMGTLAPCGT